MPKASADTGALLDQDDVPGKHGRSAADNPVCFMSQHTPEADPAEASSPNSVQTLSTYITLTPTRQPPTDLTPEPNRRDTPTTTDFEKSQQIAEVE